MALNPTSWPSAESAANKLCDGQRACIFRGRFSPVRQRQLLFRTAAEAFQPGCETAGLKGYSLVWASLHGG